MSQREEAADAHGEGDGEQGAGTGTGGKGGQYQDTEGGRPCKPPAATCSVPTADQLGWRVVGGPFWPL